MSSDTSRSEQVIEDYKRHKIARSAFRRIHDLIRGFEAGRVLDQRLAQCGLIIVLVLIVVSIVLLFSTDTLVLF